MDKLTAFRRKLHKAIRRMDGEYDSHVKLNGGSYVSGCPTCNEFVGRLRGLREALLLAGGRDEVTDYLGDD